MDARRFEFNGIKSETFGVHIVRVGGGRGEVPLWGDASILPTTNSKRVYTDAYNVERNPIEFTFTITILDENEKLRRWSREDKKRISEWLITEDFKELSFGHDPSKVYYAMVVHADPLEVGDTEGFLTLTFQTNSPYAWSRVLIDEFDLDNIRSKTIEIDAMHNVGGRYYFPEIEMLCSGGDVKITNLSDSNRETVVKGRRNNEVLYMDGQNKEIKSGLPLEVVFPKFNRQWLRLLPGLNRLKFDNCKKIIIKSQYPVL